MKTLGQKIRELRNALGLTQIELAEKLGISDKSLHRYETEKSKPDFFALSKLATFFDVSADYLLGICSYEEQIRIAGKGADNPFYKHYIKCKNDYIIDAEAPYYWIKANGDEIGGQTLFVGWVGEPGGKERRVLREVYPEAAIKLCTDVCGKPMVLNSKEDAETFLVYGGEAIVRKDICEKYLSWYLEEFIVDSKDL